MNLLPGPEQLEIVSAAGDFLAHRMPVDHIRSGRHDLLAVGAEFAIGEGVAVLELRE